MTEISDAANPAGRRRWRTTLGVGLTTGLMLAATLTFSTSANAAVDPKAPNTRFISISNSCPAFGDRQVWYRVEGKSANGRTWKVWSGNITCTFTSRFKRDTFAWAPPNVSDTLFITISGRGLSQPFTILGNENFCFGVRQNDSWWWEKNIFAGGSSTCNPR